MNDLYQVETQKTWKGKTAGGWIKECTVEQCKAGLVYIWLTVDKQAYQVVISDDGDMVILDESGIVASIEMSDTARGALEDMGKLADKANFKVVEGDPDPVSTAAAILGRRGGQAKSPRKADTSRANGHAPCHEGKRRGRPVKDGTK